MGTIRPVRADFLDQASERVCRTARRRSSGAAAERGLAGHVFFNHLPDHRDSPLERRVLCKDAPLEPTR